MTAIEFYARVVEDLGQAHNDRLYHDRLDIINDSVDAVVGQFYPLLQKFYRTEASPVIDKGRIDLSAYRVARVGSESDFVLMTRYNGRKIYAEPVTLEALAMIRSSSFQNKFKLFYAYSNNQLFLEFGSGFETTGDVVLYYPRMPKRVTTDTTEVDLPDGTPMEVAIKKAKYICRERIGGEVRDGYTQMQNAVRQLYNSFNTEINKNRLDEETRALI